MTNYKFDYNIEYAKYYSYYDYKSLPNKSHDDSLPNKSNEESLPNKSDEHSFPEKSGDESLPKLDRQSLPNKSRANEGDMFMSLPLIILAISSIFFGYITKEIFLGLGSAFFADNSLFIHSIHEIMLDTEFAVSTVFKLLPLIFTISFSVLAMIISEFFPNVISYFKLSRLGYNIFGFFNQRFFIELLYNRYISGLFYYKLGGQTTMVIDKGSVELLGPFGLEKSLTTISRIISNLSTGVITNYALYILMGLVLYISFYSLTSYDNSLLIILFLALLSIVNYYNSNIINYDSSHIIESSILYGTAEISDWFATTVKSKVIKVSPSSGVSAPKPKNIPDTSTNNTSSDVSVSNNVTNESLTNNIDSNSVLSYENITKYKESFQAARENLGDISKDKLDLIDSLSNQVKFLERFENTIYSQNPAEKVPELFNSCNYNDIYNSLFHNHFFTLAITIVLGSLIIKFFASLQPYKVHPGKRKKVPKAIKRAYNQTYLKKNGARINAKDRMLRAYYKKPGAAASAAGGGNGGGGDDGNKPNTKDPVMALMCLAELIIDLLDQLENLRDGLTSNQHIDPNTANNIYNTSKGIENYYDFINQDHPEFLLQYNQVFNTLNSINADFITNTVDSFNNGLNNLNGVITILEGILDFLLVGNR